MTKHTPKQIEIEFVLPPMYSRKFKSLLDGYGIFESVFLDEVFNFLLRCLQNDKSGKDLPLEERLDSIFLNLSSMQRWLARCQERVAEIHIQFNGLIGLQRITWLKKGGMEKCIPIGHSSFAGQVIKPCRMLQGVGLESIVDGLMSIVKGWPFNTEIERVKYILPLEIEKKLTLSFPNEKFDRVCNSWLLQILYCFFKPTSSGIASDLNALKTEADLTLKSVLELHINLERFAGRIEGACKEISEANDLPHGLEDF